MRLSLKTPSVGELARLLADQSQCDLRYEAVGAAGGSMSGGYRTVHESVVISDDLDAFDRVAERLWTWDLHRCAGFRVQPAGRADTIGTDVVLAVKLLVPHLLLACRVVRVIDDPDRAGFAYGTLPMHPESGEESFVVERAAGGVRFVITAFSRPTGRIRRLGAPIQNRIQDRFTARYLTAAQALAAAGRPSL